MASNLITSAMSMATPAVIDRIASAYGVNGDMARSVLSSAFPAIFSGLGAQAATPGGLANIVSGLKQVDPNLAGSLGGSLSGASGNLMVASGTSMLRSVLGENGLNTVINSVTRGSGVPAAAGASLVAIAGQMAMSSLASQTAGLDAGGIGKLLSSQAGSFTSNMGSTMSGAAASATRTATSATQAASSQASAAASNSTNWLMWALPVLLIAAALWYFLGHRGADDVATMKPAATTQQMAAPTAIKIGDVDVSKTLTDSFGGLTTALTDVTDPASATAAMGKIADSAKGIASIGGLASQFTPDQKAAVGALVNGSLPGLSALVAKVEAIPGVGDILKPVVDPVVGQLGALAK
jgi:hypothetical protein